MFKSKFNKYITYIQQNNTSSIPITSPATAFCPCLQYLKGVSSAQQDLNHIWKLFIAPLTVMPLLHQGAHQYATNNVTCNIHGRAGPFVTIPHEPSSTTNVNQWGKNFLLSLRLTSLFLHPETVDH